MNELREVGGHDIKGFLICRTNWDLYSQWNGEADLKRMGNFCLGFIACREQDGSRVQLGIF